MPKLTHKEFDRRVQEAMKPVVTASASSPGLIGKLTEMAKQNKNNGNRSIAS